MMPLGDLHPEDSPASPLTTHAQAHEALRVAREALYRLQALAELLSKELQRRRGNAATSAGAATGGGISSRRRGGSEAGAAAAAAAAAGAEGAAAANASVQQIEDRLLVPPATQGTKRKRGAPPEPCPFCGHCYTGGRGRFGREEPCTCISSGPL